MKKPNLARTRTSKKAFLTSYGLTCSITRASKAAKIDRRRHYDWLESDEEYRAAFAKAREEAADALEDAAVQRAIEGVKKPVTIAGQQEVIREYSDVLLIFLLKAARPELPRKRQGRTCGRD
jgi:hypothetical protein